MKKIIVLFFTAFLLVGCASSYKSLHVENMHFNNEEKGDQISYSYKFNVLQDSGNKKYAKKEVNNNVDVVAVQITNNTSTEIDVRKDLKFEVNHRIAYPMESSAVGNLIKQGSAIYLLYLPVTLSAGTGIIPIGIPIALINMISAGSSNGKFKTEFTQNNLLDTKIKPGETVEGLIGFSNIDFGNIKISVIDQVVEK